MCHQISSIGATSHISKGLGEVVAGPVAFPSKTSFSCPAGRRGEGLACASGSLGFLGLLF